MRTVTTIVSPPNLAIHAQHLVARREPLLTKAPIHAMAPDELVAEPSQSVSVPLTIDVIEAQKRKLLRPATITP